MMITHTHRHREELTVVEKYKNSSLKVETLVSAFGKLNKRGIIMKNTIIALMLCAALLFTGCSVTINQNGNNDSKSDSKQEASAFESESEASEIANASESESDISESAISDEETSESEASEIVSASESESETSDEEISESDTIDVPSAEESSEAQIEDSSADENSHSPITESKELADFKNSFPLDATLAVAHLGYCDGDYAEICEYLNTLDLYDAIPILDLITEEDCGFTQGGQLYILVPLTEDARVEVREYLMDYGSGEFSIGETLVYGDVGMPVLIRGNYSDIFSNLYATTLTETYVEEEYQPMLSLENGSLYIPENNRGVFDFTPYDLLGMLSEDWVGEWYGEVDFDGDSRVALFLNLNSDGSMTYACGYVMSEIMSSYTGSWTEEGDKLNIAMTDDSEPNGETITAVFECAVDGDTLYLTHVDGNSLIYGFDGETFVFTSGMMVG